MELTETELVIVVGAHALETFLVDGVDGLSRLLKPFSEHDRVVILTGALSGLIGIENAAISIEGLTAAASALALKVGPMPSGESVEGMPEL